MSTRQQVPSCASAGNAGAEKDVAGSTTTEWERVPLRVIATVQLGKMLSAKARGGHGALPYLRNINVRWHHIDVSDVLVMDFDSREVEKYTLRVGDVLVCEGGEPGRAAIWRDQMPGALYQKALHRVRIHDAILDPRLLVYQLEYDAVSGRLQSQFTGSTISHLPRQAFLDYPVVVPPRAEQTRIVGELESRLASLDAAVRDCLRAIRNVRRLSDAVHASVVAGDLYDATAGTASWRQSTLGEVTDIQGGIQKQPSRAPVENHYPFLRVANVRRGRLVLDDVHRVELFPRELERLRLQRGDLLIVEGNGSAHEIGRMAVWDGSIPDCVHQNHIIRARPHECVLPEFLALFWNSPQGRRLVQAIASSSSGLHTLSVSKISAIPVPVPPLDAQRSLTAAASERLYEAERLKSAIERQIQKAAALRRALLRDVFDRDGAA